MVTKRSVMGVIERVQEAHERVNQLVQWVRTGETVTVDAFKETVDKNLTPALEDLQYMMQVAD